MRTSAYTQWTGHIDMTALGLQSTDTGGELDPHGSVHPVLLTRSFVRVPFTDTSSSATCSADLLGNPLGGAHVQLFSRPRFRKR